MQAHSPAPLLLLSLLAACGGDNREEDAGDAPTWHGEVAPIVAEHCGSCHAPDGVAPFDLQDYGTASAMADAMGQFSNSLA